MNFLKIMMPKLKSGFNSPLGCEFEAGLPSYEEVRCLYYMGYEYVFSNWELIDKKHPTMVKDYYRMKIDTFSHFVEDYYIARDLKKECFSIRVGLDISASNFALITKDLSFIYGVTFKYMGSDKFYVEFNEIWK